MRFERIALCAFLVAAGSSVAAETSLTTNAAASASSSSSSFSAFTSSIADKNDDNNYNDGTIGFLRHRRKETAITSFPSSSSKHAKVKAEPEIYDYPNAARIRIEPNKLLRNKYNTHDEETNNKYNEDQKYEEKKDHRHRHSFDPFFILRSKYKKEEVNKTNKNNNNDDNDNFDVDHRNLVGNGSGCCTLNFSECINWCCLTKDSCQRHNHHDGVFWLENGAPQGQCLSRWDGCKNDPNGCCEGTSCQHDENNYMNCMPASETPPPSPGPETPSSSYEYSDGYYSPEFCSSEICNGPNGTRPQITAYGEQLRQWIRVCYSNEQSCPYRYPVGDPEGKVYPIQCWDTSSVTNMDGAFADMSINEDLWSLQDPYIIEKNDTKLEFFGDDDLGSIRLTSIFTEINDEVLVRTSDASWVGVFSLPSPNDVAVGSKFKIICNSTQSVYINYFNKVGTPIIEKRVNTNEELLLIVLEDNVDGLPAWFTEDEYVPPPPFGLGCWDTSKVTSMEKMFAYTTNPNNLSIGNWNVSRVKNMNRMFRGSHYFGYNGNVGRWDTSKVTTMKEMFENAFQFDHDINGWNVEKVRDMEGMFKNATQFNSSLENWNTSQVTTMKAMFRGAHSFNSTIIPNWDVSRVKFMDTMFAEMRSFTNGIDPYGSTAIDEDDMEWNVALVRTMDRMFQSTRFNLPLNNWNVGNVSSMKQMFQYSSFNQPIDKWDVSRVKYMNEMFQFSRTFDQSINGWDVARVQNTSQMFEHAGNFNKPLDDWNVRNVSNMERMFRFSYFNQPLDSWLVRKVTSMKGMFRNSFNFNQCLSSWARKTPDDVDTTNMFLKSLCPNYFNGESEGTPSPTVGPWCQDRSDQCVRGDNDNSDDEDGDGDPSLDPSYDDSDDEDGDGDPSLDPSYGSCENDPDFRYKGKDRLDCNGLVGQNARKKCKYPVDPTTNSTVKDYCPTYCKRHCKPCKDGKGLIRLNDGTRYSCKDIERYNLCEATLQPTNLDDVTPLRKAKSLCPVRCQFPGCEDAVGFQVTGIGQ